MKPHPLQSDVWGAFKSRWGWEPVASGDLPVASEPLILKRKLPYSPFSILYVPKGPVFAYENGALRREILGELERIARAENAILIKIDPEAAAGWGVDPVKESAVGAAFTADLEARGWQYSNEQIQFKNTVEMDLTLSEDDLLAAMKAKTRYNIRLAKRKGIVVCDGRPDEFPLMGEMYRATAVRDNFGIRPSAYYLDAWSSFYEAGMGHLLIAKHEDEPIAAVFLVQNGERSIYMYGASTHKERNRMPNYLLQWEAIRWSKAQGCTVYDFWGAPTEFVESDQLWGVWRFKKGFQARVVRHIGAWDYAPRPFLYKLYAHLLPKYINILRRLDKFS